MVKNNASTSYDMTDKSITPLVRGLACVCGAGVGYRPAPRPQAPGSSRLVGQTPAVPASPEPSLHTAYTPIAVMGCGARQLQPWPWTRATWLQVPAALCSGCKA